MDDLLECEKCVSSSQLNGLLGKKGAYLYFEKPKLQEVFLTKQSQFSQETMFKMLLF
jgi:hypothetical protein